MRKIILSLALSVMIFSTGTATTKTVTLSVAGSLANMLTQDEFNETTSLIVNGRINAVDFMTMRDMPLLEIIDLGNTTLQNNQVPMLAFSKFPVVMENTVLKEITLPASTNEIGLYAFYNCINLTTVNINTPATLTTISGAAFSGCTSLTRLIIPSTTTNIHTAAFEGGCSAILQVDPGNTVYYSDNMGALYSYDKKTLFYVPLFNTLTDYSILSSTEKISENVFRNNKSINELSIPASVTTVGIYSFFNSSALINVDENNLAYSSQEGILYNKAKTRLLVCPTSKTGEVIIPSSVMRIANSAFSNCNLLTSIQMPFNLELIEETVFENCTNLESIIILKDFPPNYKSTTFNGLDIENITLYVSEGAKNNFQNNEFWSRFNIESYILEETIVLSEAGTLEDALLNYNADKITSLILEGEINKKDFETMKAMPSLSRIDIQRTTIVDYYVDVSGISTLISPANRIPDEAFFGKSALIEIKLPESIDAIGNSAFLGTKLTEIEIPNNVTYIGSFAFWGGLFQEVILPNGISEIGESAFAVCSNLSSINIPTSLTKIPDRLFENNASLANIVLHEGIDSIGTRVFAETGISEIILPSSLKSLGVEVFSSSLTRLVSLAETPPECEVNPYGSQSTFSGINMSQCTLVLSSQTAKNNYETRPIWLGFFRIEIENTTISTSNIKDSQRNILSYYVENNTLHISNLPEYLTVIELFDINWKLLKKMKASIAVSIKLSKKNIYIFKVNGHSYKIIC